VTPFFSVVIPSYNYGRFLGECLGSIFGQVGAPAFEVIVVDDGSTDDTREVLRSFADPRLRVIVQDRNRGHAATINQGLALARGAIVSRIDPDDRYRPDFMATVCARFVTHPAAGLVYGRAAIIDDKGRTTGLTAEPHEDDFTGWELLPLLEKNFICAPTVAARREAWLAQLPVPGHLAFHDWYFTVLIGRTYPFHYVHRVLADYRVHDANHHTRISRDRSEERSVLWLLNRVYRETEASREIEIAKRAAERRVYSAHYVNFADKYFGFGLNADARRCYLAALRLAPSRLASPGVARRLAATLTSRRVYEGLKAAVKTRTAAP
jgi:glycosyltransferase involved in cell wall biosynthesis